MNNQIEVCNSDGEESSESDDDVEDTKTGELPTDIRYCIVVIMTFLDWFYSYFITAKQYPNLQKSNFM